MISFILDSQAFWLRYFMGRGNSTIKMCWIIIKQSAYFSDYRFRFYDDGFKY